MLRDGARPRRAVRHRPVRGPGQVFERREHGADGALALPRHLARPRRILLLEQQETRLVAVDQLELDIPDGVQQAIAKYPELLLAGLVVFGRDASGDTAFVSLLPHPLEVAPVHRYDHETGKLDGTLGDSIADMLVATWIDDEHADHKPTKKARKAFAARVEKALATAVGVIAAVPVAVVAPPTWAISIIATAAIHLALKQFKKM